MQNLICPAIFLILGGVLFVRWRKTDKKEKRTEAIVLVLASIVLIVFGLLSMLDAILTLFNL